jgi:hypothetical protein
LSTTAYYLAWLAAGLAVSAAVSAMLVHHLRRALIRRAMATQLLDALARCSAWVAGQRHDMLFQPDAWGGDAALEEVQRIQRKWFSPLGAEAEGLYVAHAQLATFLWTQQVLRLKDTEAWLLSEPDARFMTLWRQHRAAARLFAARLEELAGFAQGGGLQPAGAFPA